MTVTEAKEKISNEFIAKYYEWLKDCGEMPEREYNKKYGYGKPITRIEDNSKAIILFQKYIFSGRYIQAWEKVGYDKAHIYILYREGFLSYDYNSSWQARHLGTSDFYYISQKTAKEIYKAYK